MREEREPCDALPTGGLVERAAPPTEGCPPPSLSPFLSLSLCLSLSLSRTPSERAAAPSIIFERARPLRRRQGGPSGPSATTSEDKDAASGAGAGTPETSRAAPARRRASRYGPSLGIATDTGPSP